MGPTISCMPVVLACLVGVLISRYQPADAHVVKTVFPIHKLRVMLDTTGGSQLKPNATAFEYSGHIVAVNIQRPTNLATADDIVALYTHPSDPTRTVPVTWRNITATNPKYLSTGSATVTFKLLNFRHNFIFRLVENGTFSPVVLAESAVIKNTIPNAPNQVHMALHADGRSMVVQWVSNSSKPQQLQYSTARDGLRLQDSSGSSSGSKSTAVVSTSRTYTADMMCGEPAATFGFISPGYMHTAVIPGADLPYNVAVQYRVGGGDVGWSKVFSFTSQPDPTAVALGKQSFSFLVFNDVGQENEVVFWDICPPYCPGGWQWVNYTSNSTKLVKHLLTEHEARLALLVGDLSYANGIQGDWDYFGHQFEAAFSRWPLAVAPGNHERDSPGTGDVMGDESAESGGECNVPYTYRYYTAAWEPAGQYAHQGAVGPGTAGSTRSNTSSSTSIKGHSSSSSSSSPSFNSPTGSSTSSMMTPHNSTASQHKPSAQTAEPEHVKKPLVPPAPLPQWLNPYKSFYAFNMGTVHFLMLDSETPSNSGSPQNKFVVDDLDKLDRTKYPWVVACLHRQMNGPTTNPTNVKQMARLQADFEELFYKHRVDLVLQGHDHAYARTCPVYKGKCVAAKPGNTRKVDRSSSNSSAPGGGRSGDFVKVVDTTSSSSSSKKSTPALQLYDSPSAPIYILAGHAGAGFTHAFPSELPDWVQYGVQDQNGYLRVTVKGDSLTLVSISSDDGQVMDSLQIRKSTKRPSE